MSRAWVLLVCAGCSHALPSANFYGIHVETVRADLAQRQISVDFSLSFLVRNPTSCDLLVPAHEVSLKLGSLQWTGAPKQRTVIPKNATTIIPYPFHVDLNDPVTAGIAGKTVVYAFSAEAKLDVVDHGADQLKGCLGQLSGSAERAIDVAATLGRALPAELRDGKLALAYEGELRLPLMPVVSPAGLPSAQLLGPSNSVDIGGPLRALLGVASQFANKLDDLMSVTPAFSLPGVSISVRDVLDRSGLLDVCVGPLCIPGKVKDAMKDKASELGNMTVVPSASIKLPSLKDYIALADHTFPISDRVRALKAELNALAVGDAAPVLMFPTALPTGISIAIPFRLDNPNEFALRTPTFTATVMLDGRPFITLTAHPRGGTAAEPATLPGIATPGPHGVDMVLTGELVWGALGMFGLSVAGHSLALNGETHVDLGFGLVTVPFNLAVP